VHRLARTGDRHLKRSDGRDSGMVPLRTFALPAECARATTRRSFVPPAGRATGGGKRYPRPHRPTRRKLAAPEPNMPLNLVEATLRPIAAGRDEAGVFILYTSRASRCEKLPHYQPHCGGGARSHFAGPATPCKRSLPIQDPFKDKLLEHSRAPILGLPVAVPALLYPTNNLRIGDRNIHHAIDIL